MDRQAGEIVIKHFLLRRSMNKVARESEMNRHKAAVLLNAGVAWIAGRLDREQY